jgi:hypothetical protein
MCSQEICDWNLGMIREIVRGMGFRSCVGGLVCYYVDPWYL